MNAQISDFIKKFWIAFFCPNMQPLFPDVSEDKVDEAGKYILYIMTALDLGLFLVCAVVLVHSLIKQKWNIVKFLKLLLPWPVLGKFQIIKI